MWKDVPDAPGYRVSSDGMVQSCWKQGRRSWSLGDVWKPVALRRNRGGYVCCHLRIRQKPTGKLVHRLVLEAFVGPCPPGLECRHEDGKRDNNTLSNLSWGTRRENLMDRRRHGTDPRGERSPCAKLTNSDVLEIRAHRAAGMTQGAIAALYNVHPSTVSRVLGKRRWSHI